MWFVVWALPIKNSGYAYDSAQCNTAPFKEMSQRCRAVGKTMRDLSGRRFELQTSRFRNECVTAWPKLSSKQARRNGGGGAVPPQMTACAP